MGGNDGLWVGNDTHERWIVCQRCQPLCVVGWCMAACGREQSIVHTVTVYTNNMIHDVM